TCRTVLRRRPRAALFPYPTLFRSSLLMPLMIGCRKASELLLAGETLDAETAWRCDLVNRVLDDAEVDTEALALAQRLATKPRASMVLSKQLMRRAWAQLTKETLDLERELGRASCRDRRQRPG